MIEEEITKIFRAEELGGYKKRARSSKVKNIVHFAPEVMVKVSSFTNSVEHMKAHLNYISRHGKISLEDENGCEIKGKKELNDLYEDWKERLPEKRRHKRLTTSLILSMPREAEASDVKDAVRDFARDTFSHNYSYVMALHEDTNNPHVHLTINNLGRDMKKLHIKKGDPQRWREEFAMHLEKRGVSAEATPREVRGVVRQSVPQSFKHIREKGGKIYRDEKMIKDIKKIWGQEKDEALPRPWEKKIKERQKDIRGAWMKIAEGYKDSDPELSEKIVHFVKNMPDAKTKMEMVNERILASVLEKEKADKLLKHYPMLKGDLDNILKAKTFSNKKIQDKEDRERFMQKVISQIATQRLNGQGAKVSVQDMGTGKRDIRDDRDKENER